MDKDDGHLKDDDGHLEDLFRLHQRPICCTEFSCQLLLLHVIARTV